MAILVQPDGDMVLSVPSDFGADDGDLAAGRALICRAGESVRRIGADGYGRLSCRVARLIDLGLGGLVVAGWTAGGLHAAPLAWSAAATVIAGGGRWVVRRSLPPFAERVAVSVVRSRIGWSRQRAGGEDEQ
ncbi:hypothetical protein Q4F19_17245 [Sphingomonas sp. BIUV-7]|uniref:Uncharacterized protein n=1 Tax=Sphingomonas natans TaxID=3063330 RepID=A0ABT8YCP8_9SPHN|nr:hypothetical protein [Sphingomonas sp. BIUV-7]MDO6416135.1 hypothetical protein [Sphingomonas sp. BIUV-7]